MREEDGSSEGGELGEIRIKGLWEDDRGKLLREYRNMAARVAALEEAMKEKEIENRKLKKRLKEFFHVRSELFGKFDAV